MNKYSQNQNNSALVCGGNILLNARNCFLMFRNDKKADDIVGMACDKSGLTAELIRIGAEAFALIQFCDLA